MRLKLSLYFYSSLCYIQAGKKSLKIVNAIIQNTANLKKPLEFDNAKISMFTVSYISRKALVSLKEGNQQ